MQVFVDAAQLRIYLGDQLLQLGLERLGIQLCGLGRGQTGGQRGGDAELAGKARVHVRVCGWLQTEAAHEDRAFRLGACLPRIEEGQPANGTVNSDGSRLLWRRPGIIRSHEYLHQRRPGL
ncbi:hypothetical protein SDC9_182466 [bioreactor metagenome]|uniref:Uncharacterized protein n=1 Tax=bioreactor metagenome TaxID=1076179 RepID=A0A645H9C8_9ZZZZ